ncbi:MAG: hypothetical protein VYD70_00965 [Planctomycetota bacterium]|nr:hypothetical protein [Planctomycetota bacterium]
MLIHILLALVLLSGITPDLLALETVTTGARSGDEVTDQQQAAATKAYEALKTRMDEAWTEYLAPLRAAKTPEERDAIELDPAKSPSVLFMAPMLKFSKAHPATDASLSALGEVIRMASRDEKNSWMMDEAVDVVLVDFIEHEGLQDLVRFAHYNPPTQSILRLLRGVSDRSSSRDVKAASYYSLGKLLGKNKETRVEGRQLLGRVEKEFGDVIFLRETTYGQKVKGDIFEMEHLQIGHMAPEIIGQTIAGNLMQLSAFRGKVVVLDFWGDW